MHAELNKWSNCELKIKSTTCQLWGWWLHWSSSAYPSSFIITLNLPFLILVIPFCSLRNPRLLLAMAITAASPTGSHSRNGFRFSDQVFTFLIQFSPTIIVFLLNNYDTYNFLTMDLSAQSFCCVFFCRKMETTINTTMVKHSQWPEVVNAIFFFY